MFLPPPLPPLHHSHLHPPSIIRFFLFPLGYFRLSLSPSPSPSLLLVFFLFAFTFAFPVLFYLFFSCVIVYPVLGEFVLAANSLHFPFTLLLLLLHYVSHYCYSSVASSLFLLLLHKSLLLFYWHSFSSSPLAVILFLKFIEQRLANKLRVLLKFHISCFIIFSSSSVSSSSFSSFAFSFTLLLLLFLCCFSFISIAKKWRETTERNKTNKELVKREEI